MVNKLDPKVAEAIMLKAGLKPLEPYTNSTTKWKCLHIACGQIVYPVFASVNRGQGGCYECGRRQSVEKRRIPEREAVAIMLKAGLKPLAPYRNAVDRWKCECLHCGAISHPQLNMINYGQGGCKPCGHIKTGLASRLTEKELRSRLKVQKLQLVGEYKWREKDEKFKVKCLICKQNTITNTNALFKKNRNAGCENCSRQSAGSLQVSEEQYKQVLAEHNLEPFGKYTGKNDLTTVKCLICGKNKKIRRSVLVARKKKMQGCMTCSGAKIADPKKIARVMKAAKLQPLAPYSGGHDRWKCKCLKCGETVYPQFNSILKGQGGCIYCAEIGFNHKEPAYFYVMIHQELSSLKIGIGNFDSKPDRIEAHSRKGWMLAKRYDFKVGKDAYDVEVEVLRWIRKEMGLSAHLTKELMPQSGWSETSDLQEIPIPELYRRIKLAMKKGLQK